MSFLSFFKKSINYTQTKSPAYSLDTLCSKSYAERMDFKIVKVGCPQDSAVWFTVNSSSKKRIFSQDDINSYWIILDSRPSLKKTK